MIPEIISGDSSHEKIHEVGRAYLSKYIKICQIIIETLYRKHKKMRELKKDKEKLKQEV